MAFSNPRSENYATTANTPIRKKPAGGLPCLGQYPFITVLTTAMATGKLKCISTFRAAAILPTNLSGSRMLMRGFAAFATRERAELSGSVGVLEMKVS